MTREDHDAATLALITRYVGQILPCQRDMAAELGSTGTRVNHSIARLQQQGKIRVEGLGNCRLIDVLGVGFTIPRYGNREVATYQAAQPEPVRLESYSCGRCGARNCERHGAAIITTGRAGGWALAAGVR
ncbi:hypothetical protein [Sphingobium cupriresistens]|uniref:Uncharacterized protein n=1 Tax=Sphingobium cupriresistens LL01 TaxID=1420583 RepID=A0A0J7Y532_9SPHN|nr:hypothetical protein [Sphingobium cupriresistens]KMS58777.1 hypothetical protein V473_07150 [Sphingobium cupriresistens LL01]